MALTLIYHLSEKGRRESLKDGFLPPTTPQLTIDSSFKCYARLCEFVDLNTLTFPCHIPPRKKSVIFCQSDSNPFTVHLTEDGLFITSDLYFPSPTEGLLGSLLLGCVVLNRVKEVEESERAKVIEALPPERKVFDLKLVPKKEYLDLKFSDLSRQVSDRTLKPTFWVEAKWTTDAILWWLEKQGGWGDLLTDLAWELPWEKLKRCHPRALNPLTRISAQMAHASDPDRIYLRDVVKPSVPFDSLGLDETGTVLTVPVKDEFIDLSRRLEEGAFLRDNFLMHEASSYLHRLIIDRKNYEHICDREILTKKYPRAFIYKNMDKQVYKPRNCPTVDEYKHLKSIEAEHPDLFSPRFFWLEVDGEMGKGAQPVIVMTCPYGFDIVFEKYETLPVNRNQRPYLEGELQEMVNLV